jgi:hypothetical protein
VRGVAGGGATARPGGPRVPGALSQPAVPCTVLLLLRRQMADCLHPLFMTLAQDLQGRLQQLCSLIKQQPQDLLAFCKVQPAAPPLPRTRASVAAAVVRRAPCSPLPPQRCTDAQMQQTSRAPPSSPAH